MSKAITPTPIVHQRVRARREYLGIDQATLSKVDMAKSRYLRNNGDPPMDRA